MIHDTLPIVMIYICAQSFIHLLKSYAVDKENIVFSIKTKS